jgi:hypothetical protein
MISTKDLRDIFDEATKKAGDAISDAKMPNVSIGRDPTPGFLYFSIGLLFGALAGVVIAFLMTPYTGEQARTKLSEQVEKVRKSREEAETNGLTTGPTVYSSPSASYSSPASSFERS